MDRLDELSLFVAIIDAGSLAGAARRLNRSAAAATRALAALEARAGARLVARTTRRLAPTPAGLALAEQARGLVSGYEAAILGAGEGLVRGLVRITAPVLFGRRHIAPVVASFLDAYPETQAELVLADRNVDLVASPAYLAARGAPRKPGDLAAHDTILGQIRSGPLEWQFGRTRVRLAPRLIVNEVEAALTAARAGRGIARVLSYQAAEDIAAGRLVRLLPRHEPPPVPVQLVTPGADHRPARVNAFIDHASAALRALPVLHSEGGNSGAEMS